MQIQKKDSNELSEAQKQQEFENKAILSKMIARMERNDSDIVLSHILDMVLIFALWFFFSFVEISFNLTTFAILAIAFSIGMETAFGRTVGQFIIGIVRVNNLGKRFDFLALLRIYGITIVKIIISTFITSIWEMDTHSYFVSYKEWKATQALMKKIEEMGK